MQFQVQLGLKQVSSARVETNAEPEVQLRLKQLRLEPQLDLPADPECYGLGFGVQGLGLGVQGLGLRVEG